MKQQVIDIADVKASLKVDRDEEGERFWVGVSLVICFILSIFAIPLGYLAGQDSCVSSTGLVQVPWTNFLLIVYGIVNVAVIVGFFLIGQCMLCCVRCELRSQVPWFVTSSTLPNCEACISTTSWRLRTLLLMFQFAWYIPGSIMFFYDVVYSGCSHQGATFVFGILWFMLNTALWLNLLRYWHAVRRGRG